MCFAPLAFKSVKSEEFMTSESSLPRTKLTPQGLVGQVRAYGWTWRVGGAVFGLSGGIISAFVGSILTAIAWFAGPIWHGFSLHRAGTVLLFLTIPLLIFGAHCLDLMDKQNKDASNSRSNEIAGNANC